MNTDGWMTEDAETLRQLADLLKYEGWAPWVDTLHMIAAKLEREAILQADMNNNSRYVWGLGGAEW